jgi:diacylglycerol O-acyltransferase / wax synthase
MKQLTGLDASFLYMETGSSFGHVSSLSVFERPDDPDFKPFDVYRERLASKLDQLEPFRRRLVEVPFSLDHPYWIADPNFDLDFHLRHMAIPPPGDEDQLATQVARIIGRPMDRSRPLWEVYVLEGLEGDDFAVLMKIHHATIDGASGAQLLNMLYTDAPWAAGTPPTEADAPAVSIRGERIPSQMEMFNRSIVNLARRPAKALRLQVELLRRLGEITNNKGLMTMARTARRNLATSRAPASDDGDRAPRMPTTTAPATPFNKTITAHRRWAYRSVPLADIKALKSALDVTVNDVVMAICAGALRRYLENKSALPTDPLMAMIPVSIRTGNEPDLWTNRVSGLVSTLPTHIDDPVQRVEAVHDAMEAAKEQFDLVPADVLVEMSQFSPPALATRAARMAASMRIADRMNPPVNVVISNVPGPRSPLYLGEARLKHCYPVSTVADGMGLNMTVQSYVDTMDFGLVSCRELVPDLWDLVDLCVEEVDVLFEATGIERPAASNGAASAKASKPKATKAKAKSAPKAEAAASASA